ncbi:MAG: hypothetical protein AAFW97_14475 [Pseudomonadota bacterium]
MTATQQKIAEVKAKRAARAAANRAYTAQQNQKRAQLQAQKNTPVPVVPGPGGQPFTPGTLTQAQLSTPVGTSPKGKPLYPGVKLRPDGEPYYDGPAFEITDAAKREMGI